jgi:hypothetical protein
MDTTVNQSTFNIDIACSLTPAERKERGDEWGQLLAAAEAVAEVTDGYALRFPNRDAWITTAAQVIVAERKCCPFFGFAMIIESNGGPVWLHITGPREVKGFIRDTVVPSHLGERARS